MPKQTVPDSPDLYQSFTSDKGDLNHKNDNLEVNLRTFEDLSQPSKAVKKQVNTFFFQRTWSTAGESHSIRRVDSKHSILSE